MTTGAPGPRSSRDLLQDMLAASAEAELEAALGEATELLAHLEAATPPITDGEIEVLEQITGADGAPLGFISIRRRVDSGALTWQEFWVRPYDQGQEGVELVAACVARAAAAMPTLEQIMAEADAVARAQASRAPRPRA